MSTIDSSTFRELQAAAGAEFVTDLVDTFVDEAPPMLAALRKARTEGDADAYRRAAHSLKSNGLTFGAMALAAQARAIELGGLNADAARDQVAIDELAVSLDSAMAALKALCHA